MRMINPDYKMSNGEIGVYYTGSYVRFYEIESKYKEYDSFNNSWTDPMFRLDDRGRYYPSDYEGMNMLEFK